VTVPFTVFQLIGVLDAGQYTVGITINQDVATSSTTLTDGALNMTISPPTGRYVTGQTFDLAIIISGPKATVVLFVLVHNPLQPGIGWISLQNYQPA
jgi:hypothetical protein